MTSHIATDCSGACKLFLTRLASPTRTVNITPALMAFLAWAEYDAVLIQTNTDKSGVYVVSRVRYSSRSPAPYTQKLDVITMHQDQLYPSQ